MNTIGNISIPQTLTTATAQTLQGPASGPSFKDVLVD
jgi:hypothetical protein